MPLEGRPVGKLTYKLKLTPQMRLHINLLQMPLIKLKDFIKQQAGENPLLDIEPPRKAKEDIAKFEASATDSTYGPGDQKKRDYRESLLIYPTTLAEHLSRQLHLLAISEDECDIGELIIGNIDNNGYLKSPIEDIANSAKASASKVEKVLFLIQTFDPIGIGARDLRECLLLQLTSKGKYTPLAYQIVDKYLPYLEKKRYDYIAGKLKVSSEKVKEVMKEIANLEPKPGRSFSAERVVRLVPDAVLRKIKQGYEVISNTSELPRITLNEKYKKMIKEKTTPKDARDYLRERIKAARSLINAVKRRGETIQKVIESIVSIQKDFLDNEGAGLKPMTLDEVASKVGKHKSTVSRAISNKYLETSRGILELRYFLSSGVKQKSGEYLSSKAIKSKIADLIIKEKKGRPLSDQKIVGLLKEDGISISRRTVTKYRKQLKILSSQSRRE